MQQATTTYYICLNGHCPKHRNIFEEGDPQHAHCDRERLHLGGESHPAKWLWLAAPLVVVFGAVAFLLLAQQRRRES